MDRPCQDPWQDLPRGMPSHCPYLTDGETEAQKHYRQLVLWTQACLVPKLLFILHHAASGETLRRERYLHISKVDSSSPILGPEKGGHPHIGPCAPGTSVGLFLNWLCCP